MTLPEYMETNGLRDEEMAERIGCDRSYVVKLRAGRIPSPEMMATIAKKTDGAIQPGDWFDGLPESRVA
jgi:transcriptional regulator with XRE-family HTH domain